MLLVDARYHTDTSRTSAGVWLSCSVRPIQANMGWEHVLLQPSGEAEASLDLRHNMVEILCVYAEAAEVRNFFYL